MTKDDLLAKVSAPTFIKAQLDENLQALFVDEWYVLNDVTKKDENEGENALTENDFKISQTITAQINYDYNLLKNQNTELKISISASQEQIVQAINNKIYYQEGILRSKANDLKETITGRFIKEILENNFKNSFLEESFVLNKIFKQNQEELVDEDLAMAGKVEALINYNYGESANVTTKLIINIEQIRLKYFFSKFQFIDTRAIAIENMKTVASENINGFLDSNDLTIITNQILKFLNISSLIKESLVLENLTSNSIVLRALEESKNYQGDVTLTWNLKLFEIYGASFVAKDDALKSGLKGYVYLEKETKKIKFFDVFCFLLGFSKPIINENCAQYHKFIFSDENQEEKQIIFDNVRCFSDIAKEFDSFIFSSELRITIFSQDFSRIKIFDSTTNQWIDLSKETIFSISDVGKLIMIK